ncbi:MAG: methyltransferase [Propionibacteriaceae bacterium]|nr:methyltransferase [Propionibacteriaceae bacterium]
MSHYFETPVGDPRIRQVPATIWGRDYVFATSSGVFSGTRLDLGTSVLLREVAPPEAGRLLDLGCGFGPIAVALADHSPGVTVDAIDVNDRALELTRRNASEHGVAARVRVCRPEEVAEETVYDEIWSNPPIRIGKDALHGLLLDWLPRLIPGGAAYLVVGKNLGADSLQRWLDAQGYPCQRLASAKGFRVLRAAARS